MVTFTSKMEHRGNLWSDQQSTDLICKSNKRNRSGMCRLGNVWNITPEFFPSAMTFFLTLCSDVLAKSQLLWAQKETWFVFPLQTRGWKICSYVLPSKRSCGEKQFLNVKVQILEGQLSAAVMITRPLKINEQSQRKIRERPVALSVQHTC